MQGRVAGDTVKGALSGVPRITFDVCLDQARTPSPPKPTTSPSKKRGVLQRKPSKKELQQKAVEDARVAAESAAAQKLQDAELRHRRETSNMMVQLQMQQTVIKTNQQEHAQQKAAAAAEQEWLIHEHARQLAAAHAAHGEEVQKLVAVHQGRVAELEAVYSEKVDIVRRELDAAQRQQMEQLVRQHEENMQELRTQLAELQHKAGQAEHLQQQHEEQMQALRTQLAEMQQQAREAAVAQQQLVAEHASEVAELQQEKQELWDDHCTELRKLKCKNEERLQDLQSQLAEMHQQASETAAAQQQLVEEHAAVVAELQQEKQELWDDHCSELAKLKRKHQGAMEAQAEHLREEHQQEAMAAKEQQHAQAQAITITNELKQKHDQEVAALQQHYARAAEAREVDWQNWTAAEEQVAQSRLQEAQQLAQQAATELQAKTATLDRLNTQLAGGAVEDEAMRTVKVHMALEVVKQAHQEARLQPQYQLPGKCRKLLGSGGSSFVFAANVEHKGERTHKALKAMPVDVSTMTNVTEATVEATLPALMRRHGLTGTMQPDALVVRRGTYCLHTRRLHSGSQECRQQCKCENCTKSRDPNVVWVHVVMPRATASLADVMVTQEWKSQDTVSKLLAAAEVGETVAGMHALGLVCGDLKVDQVMVHKDGLKLADFGSVRTLANAHVCQTDPMRGWGTPAYMAPEMIFMGMASTAVDPFSYAPMVLEMLWGRRYWEVLPCINLDALWEQGVRAQLTTVTQGGVPATVPKLEHYAATAVVSDELLAEVGLSRGQWAQLWEVLARCLRMNGCERPSMAEVVAALRWLAAELQADQQ